MIVRPVMHSYEADNLIGLRIDEGRLEFIAVLGHGAQGDVLLARNVAPPGLSGVYQLEFYAVKVISKLGIAGRAFLNLQDEIILHQRACEDVHRGVLALHNVIDLHNTLYLVSTFAPSGDLFERIVNPLRPRLCTQVETVRSIIVQLIEAVEYLHNEKGIAHRDIKPENLFWQEQLDENEPYDGIERGILCIGDFGLATSDRYAADFGSGTSFYTSPEAAGYFRRLGLGGSSGMYDGALLSPIHLMTDAKGGLAIPSPAEPGKSFEWENRMSYDTFASDIWSIGIVLINLICERNPWQCALAIDDTFRTYVAHPEDTLLAVLPSLSDEVHDLLKKVLKVNPRERLSLLEFKEEMLKIKTFVRFSEDDISIAEAPLVQENWLDIGPRESTPGGSLSVVSAGPSSNISSGWLSANDSRSTGSRALNSTAPSSSNNSTTAQKLQPSSSEQAPSSESSNKPVRPQPVPLQIDPYRLSAAVSGHVSASFASARYAAYVRPGLAVPCPVQMPSTAPIIRLTSAQAQSQQAREDANTIKNVVKLKMPPTPAAMRARQQEQGQLKKPQLQFPEQPKEGTEQNGKQELDMAVDLSSPSVSNLVASVPCQLSLSGSTDQSSETGIVTPVDQTGPYIAFKGESESMSDKKKGGKDDEDEDDGEDQWLTIKPIGRGAGGGGYLGYQPAFGSASSGYPPITPTGDLNCKPPLTPLLLTPTSGRRYHPYSNNCNNPYSGQAAIIHSPLRMAQQAFLDRHYGHYGGGDGYLGAGMNSYNYAGGPRRGSVPDAKMHGMNNAHNNSRVGGADRK